MDVTEESVSGDLAPNEPDCPIVPGLGELVDLSAVAPRTLRRNSTRPLPLTPLLEAIYRVDFLLDHPRRDHSMADSSTAWDNGFLRPFLGRALKF